MICRILITISIASIFTVSGLAQKADTIQEKYYHQVDLLYNLSYIGHQLLFNYNHHWNRHALVIGTKYFFDSKINQPYSRFAGWKFRQPDRRGFFSHLGISIGYEYHIFKKPAYIFDPYVFVQLQHENAISVKNPDAFFAPTGPYTVIEGIIGIGAQRRVYKDLSLNASIGLGPAIFIFEGVIGYPRGTFEQNFTETAIIFRVGLSYPLWKNK